MKCSCDCPYCHESEKRQRNVDFIIGLGVIASIGWFIVPTFQAIQRWVGSVI